MEDMKNMLIAVLGCWAVIATLGWFYYSADSAQKSATILIESEAIEAVDSYVEKTADSGKMDDFIQSKEGQKFYNLIKE